jgi:hypothetical protein
MGLHLPKGPDPTAESSALYIDESSEENEGAVVSDSIPAAGDKRSAWDVDSPPTPVFPVKKSERVQASLAVTKSVTVDLSAALKASAQVTDGHKGKKKKRKRKKAI